MNDRLLLWTLAQQICASFSNVEIGFCTCARGFGEFEIASAILLSELQFCERLVQMCKRVSESCETFSKFAPLFVGGFEGILFIETGMTHLIRTFYYEKRGYSYE
nr:hypothetical protein [uncultured Carboxylicivirga sp.]